MPEASYSPECVEADMKITPSRISRPSEAITHGAGNDARRELFYALLSGPKLCGGQRRGARAAE
jgi:hypothetical protein